MKVQFETMFPWEFAKALENAPIAYLPLGVLEWHGEHNAVGLDTYKAVAACTRAARISGGIVFPPIYWSADTRDELEGGGYVAGGIEHGERYHVPGSMFWIQPSTYRRLLLDIFEAARRRGFKVIVVVTGHWNRVNIPILHKCEQKFIAQHPEMRMLVLTDRDAVLDLNYPHEHAAGAETSLMMAIQPELVDLSKTYETGGALREHYRGQPQHLQRRQTTKYKYIGILTGVDDDSNDPETSASLERGKILLETISQRIAERAAALLVEVR